MKSDGCGCWYCGGPLCWIGDWGADEVYGEGYEGIYSELRCTECGAYITYAVCDK